MARTGVAEVEIRADTRQFNRAIEGLKRQLAGLRVGYSLWPKSWPSTAAYVSTLGFVIWIAEKFV